MASKPHHSYSWLSRRLHGESGISFKTDMFKNYMFNKVLELLIINNDTTLTIPSGLIQICKVLCKMLSPELMPFYKSLDPISHVVVLFCLFFACLFFFFFFNPRQGL